MISQTAEYALRAVVYLADQGDSAAALVEEAFGDTTIAGLLDVPKARKPLCRFPNDPA